MTTKTSNKNSSYLVENTEAFTGSNMFSEWVTPTLYAVYSYGYHFPMHVYDAVAEAWIINCDKYSVSTSRQQSQTRPNNVRYALTTNALKELINLGGFNQYKLIREI